MIIKKVLLLLASVFAAQIVFAQQDWGTSVNSGDKFSLGVYAEGGLDVSSFHSSGETVKPGVSPFTGFHVGAGVNIRLFRRDERLAVDDTWLGIQAGFVYTNSGFVSDGVNVSSGYLCVPIDLQVYPTSNLFVEVGPEMCLSLGYSPESVKVDNLTLIMGGHKANDVKIGFGAGYLFPSVPAGVSIKYLIGTSNFAENLKWKGNQLRLSLFYRFGL